VCSAVEEKNRKAYKIYKDTQDPDQLKSAWVRGWGRKDAGTAYATQNQKQDSSPECR